MRTTYLTHPIYHVFVFDEEWKLRREAARFRFEPRNRFPWDARFYLKPIYISFTICVGKSTFVLLALLIPALGCPLSNRCWRCAGIVLQNGCQVTSRVTDVCGESVIHGIISEISRQRAGWVCVVVNIKWFDLSKRGCFLFLAYLPCRLHPPPIFPLMRRITRKTGYKRLQASCFSLPLRSKYSPQHPFLKGHQLVSPQLESQSSKLTQKS